MNKKIITTEDKSQAKNTTTYYSDIDFFRGYAMWCIIFCHLWSSVLSFPRHNVQFEMPFVYFFHLFFQLTQENSTGFFTFIAGFIFYSISYKGGFNFKRFMKKKLFTIVAPYLIFTNLFFIYRIIFYPLTVKFDLSFLVIEVYLYWSYWYIPFIMLIFLISSLFISYIELSNQYKVLFFVISILVAIFIGRHNYNPFLSILFWIPYYIAGITVSYYYNSITILPFQFKASICYVTAAFMLFACIIPSSHIVNSIYPVFFWKPFRNFTLIPGLLLCLSLLLVIKRYIISITIINNYFKLISKFSFTIFFIHQFFILWLSQSKSKTIEVFFCNMDGYSFLLFDIIFSTFFCLIISLIFIPIKKISGKYSRILFAC